MMLSFQLGSNNDIQQETFFKQKCRYFMNGFIMWSRFSRNYKYPVLEKTELVVEELFYQEQLEN